jgi:hypothetical protein
MEDKEKLLRTIRALAKKGFIVFTDHTAYVRMKQRGITMNDIDETLINAVEIANERMNYIPKIDKTLPAYRVKGGSKSIDIVVGIDHDFYLVVVTGFIDKG